jgi:hypothetical protein
MYFCAVGLVGLLPFAYLFCQVLTLVLYRGKWRLWCLAPLPIALAGLIPLAYVQTPGAVVTVVLAVPSLGLIALACVWGLYSKHAREAAQTEPAPEADR